MPSWAPKAIEDASTGGGSERVTLVAGGRGRRDDRVGAGLVPSRYIRRSIVVMIRLVEGALLLRGL